MPQFCGRKATSLTSFLFLYPNKINRAGTSRAVYAHCAKTLQPLSVVLLGAHQRGLNSNHCAMCKLTKNDKEKGI